MARFFRIHPAIGVARMGNSPLHFIGPETPGLPANSDDGVNFKSFRDGGKILRQGARFRVFEYTKDANGVLSNPVEVAIGNDVTGIEWRVHLANRKASFYSFYGQFGADDTYVARKGILPSKLIKFDGDEPQITNLRNATVAAEKRVAQLEIDPGEQVISTSKSDEIELKNPNGNIPINSLGTLRLDGNGRLIVLGGYGESNFRPNGDAKSDINEYANNDNWFDDAGDGSVKARIKLASGETFDADPAWVMVGPPDFAPATGNVVTLFDTIWDIAVRILDVPPAAKTALWDRFTEQKSIWKANGGASLKGYKPSFTNEIYPLLKSALGARDVHRSGETGNNQYHQKLLRDYATMSADSPDGAGLRRGIFAWIRNPDATTVEWKLMPRGLGDDYTSLYKDPTASNPQCFLSLSRIQYALLREWANGQFLNDWPGAEPVFKPNSNPTPDDLDLAAAQNSVGGPFYPGIDVSWLIRTKELYAEPFRFAISPAPENEVPFKGVQVGALDFCTGFFSQQMALPWQADFYDCHKEGPWEDPDSNELFFMWWTAHRPDDVYPPGGDKQVRWVREFDKNAQTPDDPDNENNLERFHQMQSRWHELKFICVKKADHYEEEP